VLLAVILHDMERDCNGKVVALPAEGELFSLTGTNSVIPKQALLCPMGVTSDAQAVPLISEHS